jgi:hypothetical protein
MHIIDIFLVVKLSCRGLIRIVILNFLSSLATLAIVPIPVVVTSVCRVMYLETRSLCAVHGLVGQEDFTAIHNP